MTTNLEHDPTLEEGLGHIRETYADLLPDELRPQTYHSLVGSIN